MEKFLNIAGVGCLCLVFGRSWALADSIMIETVSPNPVRPGQSLTIGMEVSYGGSPQVQFPCPMTLTEMGTTSPVVSQSVAIPPDQLNFNIPATIPSGTYLLRLTCSNGLSASAPNPITVFVQPAVQTYGPSPAPSGSDQTIQGVGFGSTQGNGYIFFQNGLPGSGLRLPNYLISSWSDSYITYTLPIIEPGSYQLTVQTNSNGNSSYVPFQVITPTLKGWVDLHTHPYANLGFGGKLFYGDIDYDPANGVTSNGENGGPCAPMKPLYNSPQLAIGPENWVFGGFGAPCANLVREQVIHTTENLNQAYNPDDSTYSSSGYPNFPTWPAWNDIMRQKMWIDWIRRAYDGGERVMVALAVNNKALGDLTVGASSSSDLPTDDLCSGDIQINALRAFITRHGPDKPGGFMELALSSSDIYHIVAANHLAVIMGVELDNIGSLGVVTNANRTLETSSICAPSAIPIAGLNQTCQMMVGATNAPPGASGCDLLNTAPAEKLVDEVNRLYNLGVRYVFPVHLMDNAIGGAAVYPPEIYDTSNIYEEGHPWNLTCSTQGDGIGYVFNPGSLNDSLLTAEAVQLGFTVATPTPISCPITLPSGGQSGPGNVNACGLTPAGSLAIQEMMHRGMLIDVDHMSHASVEQTLALAQKFHVDALAGYPLMSGHNSVRQVETIPTANERALSSAEYRQVGSLHGMSGIGSVGINACTWLNNYNATINAMGSTASNPIVGGFGTDWALAKGIPPRSLEYQQCLSSCLSFCSPPCTPPVAQCTQQCGSEYPLTCNGQPAPTNVQYNTAFTPSGNVFGKSSLAGGSWDYNQVGVAHYGMLPDFLQDVSTLSGATGSPSGLAVVSSMMFGAQYFYETWRIAEKVAGTVPAASGGGGASSCPVLGGGNDTSGGISGGTSGPGGTTCVEMVCGIKSVCLPPGAHCP
jgi:hypothetical protein